MKPFFLFGFFCLLAGPAVSQFRVFGGAQQGWSRYEIRGAAQKTESRTGFLLGAGFQTLVEGPAYFAPQLSFSQKGFSVAFDRPNNPPDSGAVNNKITLRSLDASPLVQFNLSKGANHLFLRVGPSFEFNLSGTERFDSANGKTVERAMPFSFDRYSYATISFTGQIGYQHPSGFHLVAFYTHGVGSLNNSDYGPTIFLRTAGVAAGWLLGRKRFGRS